MATYDGDITLSVDVKAEDVKKSALDIQQEIREVFDGAAKRDSVSDAFQRMQANAAKLYDQLGSLTTRMESMEKAGTAKDAGGNYTEKYAGLVNSLNDVTNRATLTKNKLEELNVAEAAAASTTSPTNSKFSAFVSILKNVGTNINLVAGRFGPFISGLKNVTTFANNTVGALMRLGSQGIKTSIAGLSKTMKLLTSSTHKQNNALQMGFKNFIRYGLGVRSLFALINKLRRALMEGLGNLAQYSSPFNAVMSQFVSSLATLQNAFATAFAPILTVVLPILSALMDALVRVITLIGQFFAALTGKGTFVRAKKVNKDYAGSLSGVGKSAGGASKGMNKANKSAKELERTIAGFDDVEILHENKPTNSGSSGGSGGGGAGGVGGLNPNDMFETIEVESPIANMANRIRELIANQDWAGLGVFLGETINSVFKKAKELISWDNLGERITSFVNAITTTFNSLVATIDWNLIGSTLAEGLNTIVNTLNLVLTGIDWGRLAAKLAVGLNSLIRNVNWEEVGQLLANCVNAVFDFLYNAFATFDWKQAASSFTTILNKFVQETDWKQVGKTLYALFKGVLQFLFQALATFDWSGLGHALLELLSGIFPQLAYDLGSLIRNFGSLLSRLTSGEGGNVVAGFLNGILAGIKGIGKWIKTNIVDPFLKGLRGHFEMGSPSKLMKREGNNVIQGFYNGISAKWKSIKSFFSGAVNGITSIFKNTDWKESGSSIIQKLNSGISGRWSKVSSFFNSAISKIKQKFSKTNWASSGRTIIAKLQTGVVAKYESLKTTGGNVITKIKSGMSSKWSDITTFINGKIDNLKSKFDISKWVTLGKNIVDGVKKGLDDNWHKVNSSVTQHSNSTVKASEHTLQVKSPSRVFRDRIGKMIPAGIAVGIDQNAKVALNAVENMSKSLSNTQLPELTVPPIAMGQIIPPSMQRALTDDGENTLKRIADVLQYNQQQAITRDELITILNTVLPALLEQYVNFYIGDEQIARHAKAGNVSLNYRFNINR